MQSSLKRLEISIATSRNIYHQLSSPLQSYLEQVGYILGELRIITRGREYGLYMTQRVEVLLHSMESRALQLATK